MANVQVMVNSLQPFAILGYDPGHAAVHAVLRAVTKDQDGLDPASARSYLWAVIMLQAAHGRDGKLYLTSSLWQSLLPVAMISPPAGERCLPNITPLHLNLPCLHPSHVRECMQSIAADCHHLYNSWVQ